jgi:hypothetical protein
MSMQDGSYDELIVRLRQEPHGQQFYREVADECTVCDRQSWSVIVSRPRSFMLPR